MSGTRARVRAALVLSLLTAMALMSTPATAVVSGGHVMWVAPPNGVDDTANIQAALDACVSTGRDCTVKLQAGTYHTSQLVEYNFKGALMGMGMNRTTIEALPNLTVTLPDSYSEGECLPDTSSCLWPSLIIFVDGNIEISDLSIQVPAAPGTATSGWTLNGYEVSSLLDVLRFMGQRRTDVSIDRVSIEGQPDMTATSYGVAFGYGAGFNVVNGIILTGELPRSSNPYDYYFLCGSLTVQRSSFNNLFDGVSQQGFLQRSQITIGGEGGAGNQFRNVYIGMDLEGSQSSFFDVSHNVSSGIYGGMWVIPWQTVFVQTSTSSYLIHDNQFTATGPYADVLYLVDNFSDPWIKASLWQNTVTAQKFLSEGIGLYNTQGTSVWGNRVIGSDGYDAIGLWMSSHDWVAGNKVNGFAIDPEMGYAQIYLDPSSSDNVVSCYTSDDVLDQGSNDTVNCAGTVSPVKARPIGHSVPRIFRSKPR